MRRVFLFLACVVLGAANAEAHKASDAFFDLTVTGSSVAGRLDVALRDLDLALALDADGDGALTWGEVRARRADIEAYALARVSFAGDGDACPARATDFAIDSHSDGAYAVLSLAARCAREPARLRIEYALLFEHDALHRGILRLTTPGGVETAIFAPDARAQELALDGSGRLRRFATFVHEGVHHIASGADHIAFLVALLLPAVLIGGAAQWRPAPAFRPVLREVLKLVTAFTAAHSLTLSLATLGFVRVSSRLVESLIALSVLVCALANLRPTAPRLGVAFAFGFGLVHGLGFASALADLGSDAMTRLATLLGFNLGVELGQLALVAVFLPLAFAVRGSTLYRRGFVAGGSLAVAGLGSIWFTERVLGRVLLGF
ncbi:MAG TPA: HupE/UreJ family protein [Myxococcota bacterium]|nr:HupE/UreJ family protein [Myxococcota bacterium]